ncbi:MAG: hypothetical protein IH595_01940 [Bacteroidales bacterium]|nr:hypothetical protein [Bacteroidales bacterium]
MNFENIPRRALFLIFPLLLIAASCHNSQKKENKQTNIAPLAAFQPGVVVDRVPCAADTSESYALYLPSDYNPNKVYPVVFFFDAHARGALVVKKYKSVAQSLNFILVASNNSENGQPESVSNKILYHFMQDVEQRFSLDPQRIYTSGFSGGARVAAGIGLFNKSVAGTIGLEAGFPGIRQIPDNHLTYVGVVGNLDFNYLELKNLAVQLDRLGMNNLLIVYPGKHALPPAEVFKRAYEFLMLDAMRKHIIPIDQSVIDSVKMNYEKIRLDAKKKHQYLQQVEADQALVKNLEGLAEVSSYQEEIKRLSTDQDYKNQLKKETSFNKTEAEYQQKYTESLSSQDAAWWKHEIEGIYQKKKAAKSEAGKLMNQRLLNYLSLMSYLYADGSIKNEQMDATKKFLMIYEMVDPGNSEVYLMKAEYYAITNQDAKVFPSLQDALDHGFNDAYRIRENAYFQKLKSSPDFQKILDELKDKPKTD